MHRLVEVGTGIDIVVTSARDGPVECQLSDTFSQRIGAFGGNDLIAFGGDDRDRDVQLFDRRSRVDFMLEEWADRQPWEHGLSNSLEGIEGRDEEQAVELPGLSQAR